METQATDTRSTSMANHPSNYHRRPAELLAAGMIRGKSVARRHGIASPETLAVVVRFGQMIDDAHQAELGPASPIQN